MRHGVASAANGRACAARRGQRNVASGRQAGADGALRTGAHERFVPIPSTGRARLTAAQWFCWLQRAMLHPVCNAARIPCTQMCCAHTGHRDAPGFSECTPARDGRSTAPPKRTQAAGKRTLPGPQQMAAIRIHDASRRPAGTMFGLPSARWQCCRHMDQQIRRPARLMARKTPQDCLRVLAPAVCRNSLQACLRCRTVTHPVT